MNRSSQPEPHTLAVSQDLRIDQICNEFEEAWKGGHPPLLEDYLARVPENARLALLRELISLDYHYHLQSDRTFPLNAYRERFPDLEMGWLVERTVTLGMKHGSLSPTPRTPVEVPARARAGGELHSGQPLGDYELLEEIAQGGMGVIFRARDIALDREVAVKVLQVRFSVESDIARRFVDEARITGQLQHPGIPAIHQVGKLPDGRPFLAMKLVKGRTLADLLSERADPTIDRSRFIAIFEQICHAVGYAHARHVIHRDLKPLNVMVGAFGEVQVMDWGLAKVLGDESGHGPRPAATGPVMTTEIRSGRDPDSETEAGSVMGTPAFMAPEQAGGEVKKLGPPTDVFGLGAILCVILTGNPPYRGPNSEAIRLQAVRGKLDDAFAELDASGAEPELITLAKHCLAVEPGDRPADAAAVAVAISELRAEAEQRARRAELERAETIGREVERQKRRRVWLGFAAAVAVAVIAAAISSLIAAAAFRQQRDDLDVAEREQRDAKRDAQEKLARSYLNEARANRLSRRLGQRFESLKLITEASRLARELELRREFIGELRNEAIAAFANPDLRVAALADCPGMGIPSVAFESSFTHYVYRDPKGGIAVQRIVDNTPVCRLPGNGYDGAWISRGGQFLAAIDAEQRFRIWKVQHASPTVHLELEAPSECFAFSADGKRAAIGRSDRSIVVYDLGSSREMRRLLVDFHPRYLAFHPSSERLAVASDRTVKLIDFERAQPNRDLPQTGRIHHVAWHPEGTHLAVTTSDDMRVSIWNLAESRIVKVLDGLPMGTQATFGPSGAMLATAGWDHVTRLWHWRTGQLLLKSENPVGAMCFSEDGRFLGPYVSGRKVGYWEVHEAPEHRLLVREAALDRGDYAESAISPNGQLLFVCMNDGVNIWDLHGARESGFLPLNGVTHVAMAPNGTLLTANHRTLLHWPVRNNLESPHLWQVGPPEQLPVHAEAYCAVSRDGMVLAVAHFNGAFVFHRAQPNQPIPLRPHDDCRYVAVSPDGQWVATGSHSHTSVKVWNAATGKLAKELLSDQAYIRLSFSPDGRWLVTNQVNAHATRVWRTGTWQEGPAVGEGGFGSNFSSDGRCIAVGTSQGAVRLFDSETERDLGRLEESLQDRAEHCRFSPDGSLLVVVSGVGRRVHVWDLRLIRKQLRELDLDWDLPAYKDALPPPAKPLQLEIKLGFLLHESINKLVNGKKFKEAIHAANQALEELPNDEELLYLRGWARHELKQYDLALGDLDQALKLNPKHAEAYHHRGHVHQHRGRYREALADFTESSKHHPKDPAHLLDMREQMHSALKEYAQAIAAWERSLEVQPEQAGASEQPAWLYVLGPVQHRDAKKALPLAERAVQLGKEAPQYLNTLGIVHYRLDRIEEAVKTLEKAADGFKDPPAVSNCLVLAMCYHRLGNTEKAKRLFDQGVACRKNQTNLPPDRAEQLDALQAEAEKVLDGK